MAIGTFSPCYGCEDRHDLCHSDCGAYLAFRKQKDEENALLHEETAMNYALARLHMHSACSRKQKRKVIK